MNIKNITKKCIQKSRGVVFELGRFKFKETGIEGLTVIDIEPFGDSRGYFMETYNREDFTKAGLDMKFVQTNESKSTKGVLRGLHFQKKFPQGKLVRCIEGEVFDVAVDLRPGSKTFGKWYGVNLSESNFREFYVPEGFAHGFYVLTDIARFEYQVTNLYHPEDEGALFWNDPKIGIDWPIIEGTEPLLSDKDKKNPLLDDIEF